MIMQDGFSRNASIRRGRRFEQEVVDSLWDHNWDVIARHEIVDGIEIDITAIHPELPLLTFYIEAKGGTIPHRSGLARTDTVKKAIGAAWALRDSAQIQQNVYFLVGSQMPSEHSLAHKLLGDAVDAKLFYAVGPVESLIALGDVLAGWLPGGGMARRL
jgi:hypothetical protein